MQRVTRPVYRIPAFFSTVSVLCGLRAPVANPVFLSSHFRASAAHRS
jgi:hypothetical protein